MMWFCGDCKEYFDETEIKTKTTWSNSNYIGHGGDFPDTESYCPYCGSPDIYECEKCELCGEEVEETYWVGNYKLCADCCRKLADIMLETVEKISAELDVDTEKARELIEGYYE